MLHTGSHGFYQTAEVAASNGLLVDLLAYYSLESNANDAHGSNNGTASNVIYSSGIVGNDAESSTGDSGITIPSGTFGTIGTGDFGVSFWVNPVAPSTGGYPMLFGSFVNSSPFVGPTIFYDPLNVNGGGNALLVRVTGSNNQYVTSPTASSMYSSRQHMVFTRASGTCKFYLNNVEKLSFTDTTSIGAAGLAYIFGRPTFTAQSRGPTGALYGECGIWDRALTATDVSTLYNSGSGLAYSSFTS